MEKIKNKTEKLSIHCFFLESIEIVNLEISCKFLNKKKLCIYIQKDKGVTKSKLATYSHFTFQN